MLEIVIILFLIIIFISIDKYKVINLFIFFLPFHAFIKCIFSYSSYGGSYFSYWKEFAILILLFKAARSRYTNLNIILIFLLSLYIFTNIFFLFLSPDFKLALTSFRDMVFPILLFIGVSKIRFNETKLTSLIKIFTVALFISCISGFLQYFILNLPISFLMDVIESIDPSTGYIYYKTPSFRIMGYERMHGLLGGPNTFGVYLGISIIVLVGVILKKEQFCFSRRMFLFIYLTLFLAILCVLLTFSRAGWIIVLTGSFILLLRYNYKKILTYSLVILTSISIVTLSTAIAFPQVAEIISSSVSGKEDSAADRTNNVSKALELILSEPLGHGLGTTDNRSDDVRFFSESIFMNIAYEIGVLGLIITLTVYIYIVRLLYKRQYSNPFSIIAIAITLPSLLVSVFSVNTYGMPFIYLWWLFIGIGLAYYIRSKTYYSSPQF